MPYRYKDSEEFRAKLFFYCGCGLCTPFGILITKLATEEVKLQIFALIFTSFAFLAGLCLIINSYGIMYERDNNG